jgi:hypothetical protein
MAEAAGHHGWRALRITSPGGIVHRQDDVVGSRRRTAERAHGDERHWHAVGSLIRRDGCCGT